MPLNALGICKMVFTKHITLVIESVKNIPYEGFQYASRTNAEALDRPVFFTSASRESVLSRLRSGAGQRVVLGFSFPAHEKKSRAGVARDINPIVAMGQGGSNIASGGR